MTVLDGPTVAGRNGVWVTYYEHPETGAPTIEAVWAIELDALRAANRTNGTRACLLPYAMDVTDHIEAAS